MCTKTAKTTVLCLLAAILTCGTFVSCGNNASVETAPTNTDTVSDTQTEIETETTVADTVTEKYSGHDYGGYEYRILSYSPGDFFYFKIGPEANEIYFESETGDSYSDAVYKRNLMAEELLNIKISPIWGGNTGDISPLVTKQVQAGDDSCDLILQSLSYNITLGTEKKVHNLKALSGIDLSADWWDQNIVSNFTYKNELLYTVAGHYNVYDDYAVPVIFCNKHMIEQYGQDDPTTLVKEGKWTLENMMKIAAAGTVDLNGDGKMDESDSFGFTDNTGVLYHLMCGSGALSTRLDADGKPVITCKEEAYLNAAEKIYDTVICSGSIWQGQNATCRVMMKEDRNMLYYELLGGINEFRDMESDFTLLPLPKGSEEQESYSALINPIWCTAMAIPVTVADPERSALVLDVMSGYSTDTVNKVLYELILGSKLIRDPETLDMLDYVLASKVYDWAEGYSWFNDLNSMFGAQTSAKSFTMSSMVEKKFTAAQTKLDAMLAMMDEQLAE